MKSILPNVPGLSVFVCCEEGRMGFGQYSSTATTDFFFTSSFFLFNVFFLGNFLKGRRSKKNISS